MKNNKLYALSLGLLASLFFSITFVLNRSIALRGGSWMWTAVLRYFFMLLCLLTIVGLQKQIKPLLNEIRKNAILWVMWSTVGFGLFYSCLAYAAEYAPAWLVACTWQITIVAGLLMQPYLSSDVRKTPKKIWIYSLLIIFGIILTQVRHIAIVDARVFLKGVIPVLLAAFAYPLGNRKMMAISGGRITSTQRVLGMTIASVPYWIAIAYLAKSIVGNPSVSQVLKSLLIAVGSGVVATSIFFRATDIVRKDHASLASVEATQSSQIIFALIGEIIIMGESLPDLFSLTGIILVIVGIILHGFGMTNSNRTIDK